MGWKEKCLVWIENWRTWTSGSGIRLFSGRSKLPNCLINLNPSYQFSLVQRLFSKRNRPEKPFNRFVVNYPSKHRFSSIFSLSFLLNAYHLFLSFSAASQVARANKLTLFVARKSHFFEKISWNLRVLWKFLDVKCYCYIGGRKKKSWANMLLNGKKDWELLVQLRRSNQAFLVFGSDFQISEESWRLTEMFLSVVPTQFLLSRQRMFDKVFRNRHET